MYYDRCGDCGQDIKARMLSKRQNVCDDCWERRGWLIQNMPKLNTERFQKIQRAMANHSGTAKRQIVKLQNELRE